MRTKFILFFILPCLLILQPLQSEERIFTFGGKAGWTDSSYLPHITTVSGFNDTKSLVLKAHGHTDKIAANADLLLTFDNLQPRDMCGNYIVERNGLKPAHTTQIYRGTGTAMTDREGITLRGNPKSFFGSAGTRGSFTIDFYLYPFTADNGEQIFSWRTSRIVGTKMISQYIRAAIFRNRIEWSFENIFVAANGTSESITFSAYTILIPERWAHHQLGFNEQTGLIEYSIDGRTEAVTYACEKRLESGNPYTLILGIPAALEICKSFAGMIDDFRIRSGYFETEESTCYNKTGGRVELSPIDTNYNGSVCNSITAESFIPPETDICYYIRAGNNVYEWTETQPKWIPIRSGQKLADISGRYIQCAAELYTNGLADKTPILKTLSVSCTVNDPPWPPAVISAEAGDGSVTINWEHSGSHNVDGYNIFYGEKPGEYFGTDASEGDSPIKVYTEKEITNSQQSLTIHGLQNGKLYYFAVAAFSLETGAEQSIPSKEVYARPKRK